MPPLDMDSLSEGHYMDCKRGTGVWEIASIVRFSEFRTEVEVAWMDGECRLRACCDAEGSIQMGGRGSNCC
jgi:hypothetical protein